MLYARGYQFEDVRKMIAENIAEEEGLKAIPEPGHEPHDHNELILWFCRAAGLTDDEVRDIKMPPAWWARSLYMYHTTANEPVGVVLAMQTTQEGQMPGLIGEVLLPAFEKHYGFRLGSPEIEFFTEHDAADVEHSRRQSRCAAAISTRRSSSAPRSGRGDLRIALGLDLRTLSLRNLGREGHPTAGCHQIIFARRLLPAAYLPAAYLIVPRCPVEHVHDEPLRREPGEEASEHDRRA